MARKPKKLFFEYEPRPQFEMFHKRTSRFTCMVCHRRAGKTVACVNELVIRAMYTSKKNARFSYIAPTYAQAKDVAWSYLKEAVQDFAIEIRESDLRVILPNGAFITLYGSDNQDRLRGIYHDGIILDEYGDCRPSLWGEVIFPSLMDRNGWAVFIGTPKGKNHFYKQMEKAKASDDWFTLVLRADTSGVFSEEQLALAIKEYEGRESEYEQEMLCSFDAAVKGTYYADLIGQLEDRGNIGKQDIFEPTQKVSIACDIGFSDSTAFWFWQARPDGIAIIDYYEASGQNLEHYFKVLKEKGYQYQTVWLPHDAKAKTLQTGRSTVEQFLEEGFPCRITPKLSIQHGIDAVRKILPRCYIDSDKCSIGVENLRAYRREWDEINQVFRDKPLHNYASDGADAFRYLCLVAVVDGRSFAAESDKEATPARVESRPMTLENLFEDRSNSRSKIAKLRI